MASSNTAIAIYYCCLKPQQTCVFTMKTSLKSFSFSSLKEPGDAFLHLQHTSSSGHLCFRRISWACVPLWNKPFGFHRKSLAKLPKHPPVDFPPVWKCCCFHKGTEPLIPFIARGLVSKSCFLPDRLAGCAALLGWKSSWEGDGGKKGSSAPHKMIFKRPTS